MKFLKTRNGKIVLLLVVLAAGYFYVYPNYFAAETEGVELPDHPNPGPTYTVGPAVHNLTVEPGGPARFVKIAVVLEFAAADPAFQLLVGEPLHLALDEFAEELGPKKPIIEDAVGRIVSAKTVADFATVAGRDVLKEEIQAAVEAIVGEPELANVYFTEFVTQ